MGSKADAARVTMDRRREQVRAALGAPYGADWGELIARITLSERDRIELTLEHNDTIAARRLRPTSTDRRRATLAALAGQPVLTDPATGETVPLAEEDLRRVAQVLDQNMPHPAVSRAELTSAWHDVLCNSGERCPEREAHTKSVSLIATRAAAALTLLGLDVTD